MNISKPTSAVKKCPNGKWRIGNGPCKYDSRQDAINAFEHWIESKTYEEVEKMFKERGQGQGTNGPRQGDGGASVCVCPSCGNKITHEKGKPCKSIKCPKCGTAMVGK